MVMYNFDLYYIIEKTMSIPTITNLNLQLSALLPDFYSLFDAILSSCIGVYIDDF